MVYIVVVKTANWIENWLDGRKHSYKESYIRYRKRSQELLRGSTLGPAFSFTTYMFHNPDYSFSFMVLC